MAGTRPKILTPRPRGAHPSRPSRRGRPDPDSRCRGGLSGQRRPGKGPDGQDRQGRRGVGRAAALPLRHQGAVCSPRRAAYSHGISSRLNEQVLQRTGPEPAQRLSSFLDRCLPSDDLLAHEWLLWQELALLCIRQPHLAAVGAELYEDLYATIAGIIAEGTGDRRVPPGRRAQARAAESAVALCDGARGTGAGA